MEGARNSGREIKLKKIHREMLDEAQIIGDINLVNPPLITTAWE